MLPYLNIIRPLNGLMSIIAVFIGGLVVAGTSVFLTIDIYFAMLAAFLISGAGNAINDYVDVDADKVNKPKRPMCSRLNRKRTPSSIWLARSYTIRVPQPRMPIASK